MSFNPSDKMVGGFTPNDGSIDFYLRVKSLVNRDSIVLDLGAGRAAWFEDDGCKTRRDIRRIKGEVRQVIAADVDEAVLNNSASDRQIIISNGVLDIEDNSIDVIVADYVLEHIDNPIEFYKQVDMCLKHGGWLCARTPHKYSYVAIVASLIKNSLHAKVLHYIQPNRKEIDVFPTHYKLNKLKDIASIFESWEDFSFIYRSEPAYYFGNSVIYKIQTFVHRLLPACACGNLFVFVRKPMGRSN